MEYKNILCFSFTEKFYSEIHKLYCVYIVKLYIL